MAWRALTRAISPAIDRCELTHLARAPIDLERARRQHEAYELGLRRLGCVVTRLPADDRMPDAVFVEDTAVMFPELAVATRPGAASRRVEVEAVAEALAPYRRVVRLEAPAALDGGDVLVAGRRVFIGLGGRSNAVGVAAMQAILEPFGYVVSGVAIHGCLHLKSAVTSLGGNTLLMNPAWVDRQPFEPFEIVEVDVAEPFAANVVAIDGHLLAAAEFPRTGERLGGRGYDVLAIENDELAKAEGAMTCGSLLFEDLR